MRIIDIVHDTIVDGAGFRTSVYVAGCGHGCKGCHNPETWDFNVGREMSEDELFAILTNDDGDVTFTGGDPMYQATSLAPLLRRLKNSGKNIWVYTGFTYEELMEGMETSLVLRFVDVLVDGPFVSSLKDDTIVFRGSSNQRLVDVQKSREEGSVVTLDLDYTPHF